MALLRGRAGSWFPCQLLRHRRRACMPGTMELFLWMASAGLGSLQADQLSTVDQRRAERNDRRPRDEQRCDRAANHEGALVETADRPWPCPQFQPFRWHLVGILGHDAPPVLKICETGRASVRMIRTVRWGFSPRR